jgi:CheY-like chemotaxis protein
MPTLQKNMEELIDWLIKIEKLAGDFYYEAAEYFKEDQTLKKFLMDSTDDESWHFHIMGSAKTQLSQITIPDPDILISDIVKDRIEKPFSENLSRLRNNELTIEHLLDCVAEAEFSEWNKIFLYVVNVLKEEIHQFRIAAAGIQGHLGRVEVFLKSFPYGAKRLKEITNLEKVFVENILIVDDARSNLELMCAILEEVGNVDGVFNGLQGLEKMKDKYYKLVVSDIDMPGMNGIEFYKAAIQEYPNLKNRFIFMSGHVDDERTAFFKENGVTFFPKPCDIDKVLDAAINIINQP